MSAHNIQYLAIKDEVQLYRMYMPFLQHGGLFIPGQDAYSLGDEIFLLLQLPDDPGRLAVSARAVWITAGKVQPPRVSGTGFHFMERHEQARARIEACLGAVMESGQHTYSL